MFRTPFAAIALLIFAVPACAGQLDGGDNSLGGEAGTSAGPGAGEVVQVGSAGAGGAAQLGVDDPWMPPVDGTVFQGPIVSSPGEGTRFARLTHKQWEQTVGALLGLSEGLGLSSTFVSEPLRSMFDTNGGVLSVSPDLWLDYQRAAETVGQLVAQDAAVLNHILPNAPTDPAARAQAFVEAFGLRAYRRPLTATETTRIVALFNQGPTLVGGADAFLAGVTLAVSFMLQSPHFLYRAELSSEQVAGRVPLNGHEVASRLSYGLLNTMPDDALFTAAASGSLLSRDEVLAQAVRLLASTQAASTIEDFHSQFLRMQEYTAVSRPNPLFENNVGADLLQEAMAFTREAVLGPVGTLSELLTAPYTFGNSRIRDIYGQDVIAAPSSNSASEWGRIDLDPTRRAGLLTQLGFLVANGEGSSPNTIMRGVHLSQRVLCVDLPVPPNMIPPLPELSPDQTNRERVQTLTGDTACVGCHGVLINPVGFAFEHYDGLGQYRDTDNGLPVDASSTYALDGASISYNGAVEFSQAIAASDQAHNCYARRWAEYIYGRDLDPRVLVDDNLILQGGALSKGGAAVTNLIAQLVATEAFLTRLP